MQLLISTSSLFHRYTHGYWLAKRFFESELQREVFVTIHDSKRKVSTYGYLFLTQQEAFLFVSSGISLTSGVYNIEPTDTFELLRETSDKDLATQLQGTGFEKSLRFSVSNPIALIGINNRKYLLLTDIQPDLNIASRVFNLKTHYFTSKDFVLKVQNLITLLEGLTQRSIMVTPFTPLPGIERKLALINIYAVSLGSVLTLSVFAGLCIKLTIRVFKTLL